MDVQHFLAVNMIVISALAIVMSVVQIGWRNNVLWVVVNGLVVAAGLLALRFAPLSAGAIVGVLFCPLVLAPLALGRLVQQAVLKGRLRMAAFYGSLLALLHPTRQFRLNAAVGRAQALPDVPAQVAAMEAVAADASPAERIAVQGHILRAQNDWPGLLAHLDAHRDAIVSVGALEVRALGEVGRLDEMAAAYERTRPHLFGFHLIEAQLAVLAFSGRVEAVEALLKDQLSALSGEARAYWIAIAQRAGGVAPGVWQEPLRRAIAASSSATFKTRAQRLIEQPADEAVTRMSDRARAIADLAVQRSRETAVAERPGVAATPVSWLLLLAIVAVYVMSELRGGATDLEVLVDMGALWPPYVEERGEWWRLFTAMFLHLGLLHLAVNSLMLFVLGRPAELSYGSVSMLIVYVVGGIASSGFVLWLAISDYAEPAVLIGASGAIMALFGALMAHRLVSWLRWRDPLDKRALVLLPAILVLQIAADLSTPQVSLAAHASGFVAGMIVGLLLASSRRPQRPLAA